MHQLHLHLEYLMSCNHYDNQKLLLFPFTSEIFFVINETKLLLPIPVIAKIPRCLETILSKLILASISLFRSKLPIFNHPSFFGLKISSKS